MGRVVGGRYELHDMIGGGSYGSVWAAWDRRLREWVAVKRSKDPGEESLLRFVREQRLILQHPNLCAPIDFGFDEDSPFIVMELVRGGTLAQQLSEDGPLPHRAVEQLVAQLEGALTHLHDLEIVHRDVQPSNILLGATPPEGGELHAYLTDFGSALRVGASRLTSTNLVPGTAGYRSPEVCAGHEASEASDRYSLAIVAYEAATGVRIAHTTEPHEPAGAVRFAEPADLDLSGLTPALRAYLEANLNPDPPCRTGAIPELHPAEVVVSPRIDPGPAPASARGLRRPLALAVAAIAVLIVGGVTAVRQFGHDASAEHRVLRVDDTIRMDDADAPLSATSQAIWIGSSSSGELRHVSPSTHGSGSVDMTKPSEAEVPEGLFDISATPGAAWVSTFDSVVRVDSATNRVLARVRSPSDGDFDDLSATHEDVWVLTHDSVVRIATGTNTRVGEIQVEAPAAVSATFDGAWVVDANGRVIRIDPGSNKITRSRKLGGECDNCTISATSNGVWVANLEAGTLTRLHPSTLETIATLHLDAPFPVVATADQVWVLQDDRGSTRVSLIDPSDNTFVDSIRVANAIDLSADGDGVWVVTSTGTGMGGTVKHIVAG